jgi:nitronate monooxygenase
MRGDRSGFRFAHAGRGAHGRGKANAECTTMGSSPTLPFREDLVLPLMAAPMFLVSGVDLVVAACTEGVIGSFPTANCRSVDELDAWLTTMRARIDAHEQRTGRSAAPIAPNLIVHASNPRLAGDLAAVIRARPKLVITSVGSPEAVLEPLQESGVLVFADVASIRHAERAAGAGADGLVLLTAGAGGQAGWLNPFAFVRAVRAFFDGPLVLAGGGADGHALHAVEVLGCELGYMGTKFIATHESMAADAYKEMLTRSTADDILLTRAFTGLQTNMLKPSIVAAGLDPDHLPERGSIDISQDINVETRPERWRDIWSAGHTVSSVKAVQSVASLIAATRAEYEAARRSTQAALARA